MLSDFWIGFPPPLLGNAPIRLRGLFLDSGLLALAKLPRMVPLSHSIHRECPSLESALQQQLSAGKPELLRLGFSQDERVNAGFFLDSEVSGVCLFSRGRESRATLKNAIGSCLLTFQFVFLARNQHPREPGERRCSLPLAADRERSGSMRVSHTRGKRSETRFRRQDLFPRAGLELWQATTSYLRPHQIRVHARECGLEIPGDAIYGDGIPLFRETFYRRPVRGSTPAISGLPLHLHSVSGFQSVFSDSVPDSLSASLPGNMEAVLKRLQDQAFH